MYEECKKNGVKIDFRKEKIGFVVIFDRKSKNLTENINNEVKILTCNYKLK